MIPGFALALLAVFVLGYVLLTLALRVLGRTREGEE